MRRQSPILATLGALAAVLLVADAASAEPFGVYGASAYTSIKVFDYLNAPVIKDDVTSDPFLLGAGADSAGALPGGIASASASALADVLGFGLHAHAQATIFDPSLAYDAIASASAEWNDTITIVSDTLAAGTPMLLRLTMHMTASFTTPTCPAGPAGAASSGGSMTATSTMTASQTGTVMNAYACEASIQDSGPALLSTAVGDTVYLRALLGASAESHNGLYDADASHTLRFFVDSMTDGASYTTASGYSYFTPTSQPPADGTPEPASLLLMATGAAGLAGRRRFLRRNEQN